MTEKGFFNSWRSKKTAELVSRRFIDLRNTNLKDSTDILVDKKSAIRIKEQIGKKEIPWVVHYHGVVLPDCAIKSSDRIHSTKNCVSDTYINYFVFEESDLVDWYILSPNYQYFSP